MSEQTEQQDKEQLQFVDDKIISYLRAGYPMLYMVSPEEARAEAAIIASAATKRPDGKPFSGKTNLLIWSTTTGIVCPSMPDDKKMNNREAVDPVVALAWVKANATGKENDKMSRTVFIFRDLHAFFPTAAGIKTMRFLRDLYRDFQPKGNTLIVLSPVARLPIELQRDFQQIEFKLPTKAQIGDTWHRLYSSNAKALKEQGVNPSGDDVERIIDAAMGLTTQEATNAFSMAITDSASGKGDMAMLVLEEKAQAVKKSGILEYYHTVEDINSIGGLDNLKLWLQRRAMSFSTKAKEFGLPIARGALLVGIPGGGKSLAAKASAAILKVPLIRFDIARVFGGLVGQSEENMRTALGTIDAIGPCVVWLDEMEKAFAGAGGSGSGDNGVTRRVFGNFLTWMQEKTTPSFVMATANSIIGIPPELLRKGRFDENFYIDIPDELARGEIFKIQVKKYGRAKINFDYAALVNSTQNFTGAEIESAIKEGLYLAFGRGHDLTTDDIIEAAKTIKPIVESQKDELDQMTQWAKENAVNASKTSKSIAAPSVGRQLAI